MGILDLSLMGFVVRVGGEVLMVGVIVVVIFRCGVVLEVAQAVDSIPLGLWGLNRIIVFIYYSLHY
jgi:hypothetical protein